MDFFCHSDSPGSYEDKIKSARDAEQRAIEAADIAADARREARLRFRPPAACPWCADRDWRLGDTGDKAYFDCLGCDARLPSADPATLTEDGDIDPAKVWEEVSASLSKP